MLHHMGPPHPGMGMPHPHGMPPGMPPGMYHAPPQYHAPSHMMMPPQAAHPAQYAAAPTAVAQPKVPKDAAAATITGASTVLKRPLAHQDKMLLSMVPAALRVRRDDEPKPKRPAIARPADVGFGLAPKASASSKPAEAPTSVDQKYLEFVSTIADLGAFE